MTAITATTRSQTLALIKTKEANVLKALSEEISVDSGEILLRLLGEQGIQETSNDLESEHRRLSREKDNLDLDEDPVIQELNEEVDDIDDQIRSEIEMVQLRIKAQIDTLHAEERDEIRRINQSKADRVEKIREKITERERVILTDHPGLVERLEVLPELIKYVEDVERSLRSEVRRQQESIQQSRGRLQHLVRDASVRAQEMLISCETTEQAGDLLNIIPSIAEVIATAENPDQGLKSLVERLKPTHQLRLAPPTVDEETPIPVTTPKPRGAIIEIE